MKQTILIEIINSLQKKEIRDLRKFLLSPFFNQREDVILLFEYLVEEIFNKKEPILKKTKVFEKIYPNEAFSDKKIRYTMSFLLKNIKKYLSYQEFSEKQTNQNLQLLNQFRKKNLDRPFHLEFEKTRQSFDDQPFRNSEYQYSIHQLHFLNFQKNVQHTRATIEGFSESNQFLTQFFMANQLKMACYAASLKTVSGRDLQPNFLPYILEELQHQDYSQIPAVGVYHLCYQALVAENPSNLFNELRQQVLKFQTAFSLAELREIYGYILNYFIRQINEGKLHFKRAAFEAYQEGLALGIFLENGQLSRFHYKNIVASGLGLDEFKWVGDFIENYKNLLEKKYRESTYAFNLALLFYKQNNYPEAMTWLQKVGTDDVLNNLNARRMLLRIYYDLNEFDALESLLDSFRNYIYRHRDLGYQKELYLNLIKFTRRLLSLDFYNKKAVNSLQKEIEKASRLAEKMWLLEKLFEKKPI